MYLTSAMHNKKNVFNLMFRNKGGAMYKAMDNGNNVKLVHHLLSCFHFYVVCSMSQYNIVYASSASSDLCYKCQYLLCYRYNHKCMRLSHSHDYVS